MVSREKLYTGLLHVHSGMSLLHQDLGISPPLDLIKQAEKFGYDSLVITDHSNMFAYLELLSENPGLNLIPGVELPLTTETVRGKTGSFPFARTQPIQASFLANNIDGVRTLFELTSQVAERLQNIDPDQILPNLGDIKVVLRGEEFPPRIQSLLRNPGVFWGLDTPLNAVEISKRVEEIAGPEHVVVSHRVLAATPLDINILRKVTGLKEGYYGSCDGEINQWSLMPLRRSLVDLYHDVPEALWQTSRLGQEIRVPKYEITKFKADSVPKGENSFNYLKYLLEQNPEIRKLNRRDQLRLEHELDLVEKTNASDIILVAREIADFCRDEKIAMHVAGSGNNSFLLYLLGITDIDAREHYFHRFIHPQRKDPADIDFHFATAVEVSLVEKILKRRYGEDKVFHIAKIIHTHAGQLEKLGAKSGVIFTKAEQDRIEEMGGVPRSVSFHSSGVVIDSDRELPRQTTGAKDAHIVLQIDKNVVDDEGVVKLDLLTDSGMAITMLTLDMLGILAVDYHPPVNDEQTMQKIAGGDIDGLFMLDTFVMPGSLQRLGRVSGIKPQIRHLSHLLALARSAPKLTDIYFQNSVNPPGYLRIPALKEIFGESFGTIVYQDQVGRIAEQLAGMSAAESLKLSKIIGDNRRAREAIPLKQKFRKGLIEHGMSEDTVRVILLQSEMTRPATFVEGHSEKIAEIVYEEAYLAAHHPGEFWTVIFRMFARNKRVAPQEYINTAIADGVEFEFPDTTEIYYQKEPDLVNGKIRVSTTVMRRHRELMQAYNRFLTKLSDYQDGNLSEQAIINYQIDNLGVCFTHRVDRKGKS